MKPGERVDTVDDVLKADARKPDGGELVAAWIEMRNYMDDVAKELQLNAAYVDIAKRLNAIAKGTTKAAA